MVVTPPTAFDSVSPLGFGASGTVHLLKCKTTGRHFAGKKMACPLGQADVARREHALLASLSHENIIRSHDVCCEADAVWMVLEYGGATITDILLENPKMLYAHRQSWCGQALSAVSFLHSRCVVHLDIKLDNMSVTDTGVLKLLDFGSAHVFSSEDDMTTPLEMLRGTAGYLCPEALARRPYDGRSADSWSLGITLFGMLLNYFPFTLAHPKDKIYKWFAVSQQHGSLSTVDAIVSFYGQRLTDTCPRGWIAALERLLTVDPSKRMSVTTLAGLCTRSARKQLASEACTCEAA